MVAMGAFNSPPWNWVEGSPYVAYNINSSSSSSQSCFRSCASFATTGRIFEWDLRTSACMGIERWMMPFILMLGLNVWFRHLKRFETREEAASLGAWKVTEIIFVLMVRWKNMQNNPPFLACKKNIYYASQRMCCLLYTSDAADE